MSALTPAADLAATNKISHPNESAEYRTARQALLVEEIELRRAKERVAQLRRELPPGGPVPADYAFVAEDADDAGYNVFTKRDGELRHFWGEEIGLDMNDPGEDARGAIEMDPLWSLLDTTPGGRGTNWYPSLTY